ncbi:hypothetical protein FOL47_007243 [Perkinsus chesapeaki]|uniref:Uncharacterized protein n=1 Tax=Perkinsus chesapeaki TaxID=330153 RepID=A0A7J6MWT3_PERCH|nr:hypothetical protein FOL47_007243 [Perkinsus chesapeaki]
MTLPLSIGTTTTPPPTSPYRGRFYRTRANQAWDVSIMFAVEAQEVLIIFNSPTDREEFRVPYGIDNPSQVLLHWRDAEPQYRYDRLIAFLIRNDLLSQPPMDQLNRIIMVDNANEPLAIFLIGDPQQSTFYLQYNPATYGVAPFFYAALSCALPAIFHWKGPGPRSLEDIS